MDNRQTIIDAGLKLINDNLTVETWGNISIRDDSGNIFITPSGMDYKKCSLDDIVVLSSEGKVISGHRKPSIEKDMHILIYKHRKDVKAIVHTHPINSTIFACQGLTIPLIIDEAAQTLGSEVKTACYALPGSMELANNCVRSLGQDANACLLQSHGAVCVGHDISEAFKVARVLEMTAEIYWKINCMNGKYLPISRENIQSMKTFVKAVYGQR